MVTVPYSTFLSGVDQPAGTPILTDPYQFAGAPLNINMSAKCPDLFSSSVGVEYCRLACINTCPGLFPNATMGLFLQLHQNQTLLAAVQTAASAFKKTSHALSAPVVVKGSVAFSVPAGLGQSAIATVARNVAQLLPANAPFPTTSNV